MHIKLFCSLLLLSALGASNADARSANYGRRAGFAFNFAVGATNNPFVNYVPEPINYKRSFTPFYSMSPSIDGGNWAIEPTITWYDHPSMSGDNGTYQETAKANTFAASGRLRLFPVIWAGNRARAFFGVSYGVGQSHLLNKRKYASGAEYSERLRGKGAVFTSFAGVETYLIQNYVGAIELGYRNYLADDLKFNGGNDASGATVNTGDSKLTATGRKSFLEFRGFYFQINFGVQF